MENKFIRLLFLLFITTSCFKQESTPVQKTEVKAIIGKDDRKTITDVPTKIAKTVGSLTSVGIHTCTAVVISPYEILTASHCYENLLWGTYEFKSLQGKFKVHHHPKRINALDLVILPIQHDGYLPPRFVGDSTYGGYPIGTPIFSETLELGDFKPSGSKTEIYSLGYGSEVFHASHHEWPIKPSTHILIHSLDTIFGGSGSPLLQDGKVVGIHIGNIQGTENVAARVSQSLKEEYTLSATCISSPSTTCMSHALPPAITTEGDCWCKNVDCEVTDEGVECRCKCNGVDPDLGRDRCEEPDPPARCNEDNKPNPEPNPCNARCQKESNERAKDQESIRQGRLADVRRSIENENPPKPSAPQFKPNDIDHNYDLLTGHNNRGRKHINKKAPANEKPTRNDMLDASDLGAKVAKDLADQGYGDEANSLMDKAKDIAVAAVDLGTDVTPGVALVKDATIILTGVNPVTGEEVSTWERVFAGATLLVPAAFSGPAKLAIKGLVKTMKSSKALKNTAKMSNNSLDKASEALEKVINNAKKSVDCLAYAQPHPFIKGIQSIFYSTAYAGACDPAKVQKAAEKSLDSVKKSGITDSNVLNEFVTPIPLRPNSSLAKKSDYNWKDISKNATWEKNQLNRHAWERHPGLAKDTSNQLPNTRLYDQGARNTIKNADIVIQRTKGDVVFINTKDGLATSVQQRADGSWKLNSYRMQTLDP